VAAWQGRNLELDADRVLAAQGADPATIRHRHPGLLAVAERALREGEGLIEPAAVRATFAVTGRDRHVLHLAGGGRLRGDAAVRHLGDADAVVVAVCTVGPALEQQVSEVLADDGVLALAFDGLGTAAVDALASAVCADVAGEASMRGWRASVPLSPGMTGWPLAEGQDDVFSLVDAAAISVSLTPSRLMIPRKSVSMVVGIGPGVSAGGRTCDVCNMKATCRYRTRTEQSVGNVEETRDATHTESPE
jgi:hypothetical protein